MKTRISQTVETMILPTVNRGTRKFIVSVNEKGQFFAHEIGNPTQWAAIFEADPEKQERNAHKLNPTRKHGNQYGKFFRAKPFTHIGEARQAIIDRASQNVIYA